MEESSDAHMETDVSSTTADVPYTQEVTGSNGEVVIVIEKVDEEVPPNVVLKEEDSKPTSQTNDEVTGNMQNEQSDNKSPQKDVKLLKLSNTSSNKVSLIHEPETDNKVSSNNEPIQRPTKSLQKDVHLQNILKNTSMVKVVQVHGLIQRSPPKSVSQTSIVKTPIKNMPTITIQVNKAVTSTSNIDNQKSQIKSDENTVQDTPTKAVEYLKTVTKSSSKEISNVQKTPVKAVEILKTVMKSPSKETSDVQKTPVNAVEMLNTVTKLPSKETSDVQMPIKAVEIMKTVTKSPPKESSPQEPTETTTKESEETKQEENIKNNIKKQEELTVASADMISDMSNELHLESNIDNSEKEHNKSISRELKSLINSAKESKIISECTQLTSKTRKSRGFTNQSLDASNTSLNTSVEAGKMQGSRRSSNNSQRSNSSEVSEKASLKRSMRSQNPEFVNKVKQFLNSVTGRGQKHDNLSDEEIDNSDHHKTKESLNDTLPKKKKKSHGPPPDKNKLRSDPYCWRCHWPVEVNPDDPKAHAPVKCTVCPRSFHFKCLSVAERNKVMPDKNWVCPECMIILHAESSETRSSTMKGISLGMLCDLLKHALERMTELNGVEPFMQPVDRTAFPDYDKYVVHPMDLTLMKENINAGLYGSSEAFLADAQWILHNSIIFNTLQSKLTSVARTLLRTCRVQLCEIDACPECYAAAYARRPTWFTDVCSTPHILLWAKLKGFPYWPAKGMSVNSSGMVDVRFFGAHDRAWVPAKDCYLFSERDPNNFRTKRQDILDSVEEAEQHIRNISRKYGSFVYPPYKIQFDGSKLNEQLKMMIPSFEGEVTMSLSAKDKSVLSSPNSTKSKSRSNSKASKDSNNDCDMSENEDNSVASTHKTANGAKLLNVEASDKNKAVKATSQKEDNTMEVDTPQGYKRDTIITDFQIHRESSKKRRRSEFVEAVITVLDSSSTKEKRKRIDRDQQQDDKKSDRLEETSTENDDNSTRSEKITLEKNVEKRTEQIDPSITIPASIPVPAGTSKTASIHKAITPKTDKQTPKATKEKNTASDKDTSKDKDAVSNDKDNASIVKNNTDKTSKQKPTPRSKSTSKDRDKSQEEKTKKRESAKNNKSGNSVQITLEQSDDKTNSTMQQCNSTVNTTKDKDKADTYKSTSDRNSTPKLSNAKGSKSTRERLTYDDNTSLAEIAREVAKNNIVVNSVPGLPTISSVRSLSNTSAESTLSKGTPASNTIEVTIETNSDSSVFTPTSTDNVRNVKDATNKLQKLRNSTQTSPQTQVGRVGVRAFARMSPSPKKTQKDDVEVEIKTEPIDYDDERQMEKMNLMNVFKLRPVNPMSKTNLRDVRINRVIAGPPIANKKASPPQIRPRARKTFPQPKKPEEASGLNSKNSMVYIPIQPPMTQPPVKISRSNVNIAPSTTGSVVTTATTTAQPMVVIADKLITTTANNMVNMMTTPLMSPLNNSASTMPILSTLPTVTTHPTVPTVGQVPTNVHTVPLITSVNGQWTFSLQPVMSVGGVDGALSPPIMNGICERPAILATPTTTAAVTSSAVPPLQPTTNAKKSPGNTVGDLTEPPRLQQRPSMTHPLDSSTPVGSLPPPSSAGPMTAKLNQNAVKLTDFFRNLLEDSLELVDDPTAQAAALKLQLEQTRWRHQQEIDEIKHNHELVINEMRGSFEKDKNRAVAQLRHATQTELEAAVKNAKSKQWCVYCKKEAQFYCCWNTAYCDYPCQRAHWAVHHALCTQKRTQDGSNGPTIMEANCADSRLKPQTDNNMPKSGQPAAGGGKSPAARPYNESQPKSSFIVSMVEDSSGNQTMKCVGTYNSPAAPLVINKQLLNKEESKKVVTSGGYLIVGASNTTIANSQRTHSIQYYPS